MTFEDFKTTLAQHNPPQFDSPYLLSMWYDAKKQWDKAHNTIQDLTDKQAAFIHAYLHRKEGDAFNAGYWYRKAGKNLPDIALDQEWEMIVRELL